uniref:Uncharacterized protein n=1 Tax=Panagrolaimus davidi TaxID=227884 RepID=A0A914Q438_9BILA
MLYLVLFAICFSILIDFVNALSRDRNGWSCWFKTYDNCPEECPIDDCDKPIFFNLGQCDKYPKGRFPKKCRCDYYNQGNCPTLWCDYDECDGYVKFAWYWYLVIVGVILGIIALIIVIVCIRASMSRKRANRPPQDAQPTVVATVRV